MSMNCRYVPIVSWSRCHGYFFIFIEQCHHYRPIKGKRHHAHLGIFTDGNNGQQERC